MPSVEFDVNYQKTGTVYRIYFQNDMEDIKTDIIAKFYTLLSCNDLIHTISYCQYCRSSILLYTEEEKKGFTIGLYHIYVQQQVDHF